MSQDPRILMLGHGWFPDQMGGLDRYFRELFEQLPEARGVTIGGAGASPPARLAGVSAHTAPLPQRLLSFWRAAQREADEIDVVDAHFALYALLPLWLGRLRHKPVLLHFHGPWADENVSAGDASRLHRRARRLLERAAYARADRAVVLTSAFRQVLVERYGVSPWSVEVLAPGIDLERFSLGSTETARDEFGLAQNAFVAVAVRRLVPRMGLELLVDAWLQCLPELPPGSALLIAGSGPLAPELERRTGEAPGGGVRMLGRVSDEQLVQLYRAADVAVVPSLEHEGFGLVVLEAAACGTATIVADVGGLPEAVAGLDPSLVVRAGDRPALTRRLLDSVDDRPSRLTARRHAERHDWRTVADRHRDVVRRAIGAPDQATGRKLRVVYLDHVARMSGGEIAMLRLLPHLESVQPHVILAEDGPLVGQLHLAGISTEVLPFAAQARDMRRDELNARRGGQATLAYVHRLAARLRHLRPDVVHANSLKSGVYGSLAARLAGVPLVWHVRDWIEEEYLPPPAVRMIREMTRHLASAVIANSHATMATLRLPSGREDRYQVLPDVLGDVPVREPARAERLTFGVVGRLSPWKGQDLFLRAFAQAFPESDERAVLVGGALFGEDEYASQLPRLADQLGISDRVELRGHQSDVWSELARLDVLVHSSITPEPFGQVILEGMAARVPVIAADVGGPAEIINNGQTGVLYARGSGSGLAQAMQGMRDPALRERLSRGALGALWSYAPEEVADPLQWLYYKLTADSRR